jgi:hypothetical protein
MLILNRTKVTDAGLREVKRCTSLHEVQVWRTPVTEAGAQELKATVPEVRVLVSFSRSSRATGRDRV